MKEPGRASANLRVRPVEASDLDQVIAIDAEITQKEKTDYWYELFYRYGAGRSRQRLFLVAETDGEIHGFIIGEVRDWEFGSPPCGWVFGISVRPGSRGSPRGCWRQSAPAFVTPGSTRCAH
jgi:hypothetical protein